MVVIVLGIAGAAIIPVALVRYGRMRIYEASALVVGLLVIVLGTSGLYAGGSRADETGSSGAALGLDPLLLAGGILITLGSLISHAWRGRSMLDRRASRNQLGS
jgi:hypothetical protein